MAELPDIHPWLYEQLINGFHSIQHNNRYWTALPTDLVTEQTVMRSAKSQSVLTHG